MFWKTLLVALCVVGVFAEEYKLSEEHRNKLKDTLRDQCKKQNAEDKVDEIANVTQSFVTCIQSLFNVTQLKQEIEDAKPNGALDEVFKKYCAKTPQLKTCIHTMIDGVSPCLDQGAKDLLPSAKNGTDQLIDFVCFKDGDRIALFIAEKGPECFQSKMSGIRQCGENIKNDLQAAGVEGAKAMTLRERCQKFDVFSNCTVMALEGCDTPTPGNMAESLFRFVRKSSPCDAELPPKN